MSWRKVGKVKDAHGLKGELYILIFSQDTSWLKELKTIKLSEKEYTLQKAKIHKDGFILQVAGITDRTQAEALRGQMFFIPEDLFDSEEGDTIYLSELEGFQVSDETTGPIGTITGFLNNGAHDLFVIQGPESTFEIPFVEAFVKKIDYKNKLIQMDLPEGILELNKA